jgi:hypothetical protein
MAAMPISRQPAVRMFCLCSGLAIQSWSACLGSTSGDDQRRFSPTDGEPCEELEYAVRRFQNGSPSADSCAK